MAIANRSSTSTESYHDRYLAQRLEDSEFRRAFERARAETNGVDAIVNQLDELRVEHGMSTADLAREIDKNPSSIRRLLTLDGANPELRTVVTMANALDADLRLVPGPTGGRRNRRPVEGAGALSRLRPRLLLELGDTYVPRRRTQHRRLTGCALIRPLGAEERRSAAPPGNSRRAAAEA
jgi:transcriptional regulator with XRE-family HTH domain